MATEVFPEPELPAMPMMLKSAHGGEYCLAVADEYTGGMDSMVIIIPVPSTKADVWCSSRGILCGAFDGQW